MTAKKTKQVWVLKTRGFRGRVVGVFDTLVQAISALGEHFGASFRVVLASYDDAAARIEFELRDKEATPLPPLLAERVTVGSVDTEAVYEAVRDS